VVCSSTRLQREEEHSASILTTEVQHFNHTDGGRVYLCGGQFRIAVVDLLLI